MNKANGPIERIKIGLVIGWLMVLMGCVGYVAEGYYDGGVVVPEPDVYLFGGEYYGGRDARDYSHRGFESRAAAHSRGNHREAHGDKGGRR
jgi:hypothetical protein